VTTIATISLTVGVTATNYSAVLDGVKQLLEIGTVFAVHMAEPLEPVDIVEPAPAAARTNGGEAPKAGRRSRKTADAAPAAEEPAAKGPPVDGTPADVPEPELAEAVSEAETVPEQPAPAPEPEPAPEPAADAPLTMEVMTDKLNAFAKIHGVAATRKAIQSFGVTRLSELEQERWAELLAKLKAENGGKPV